MKVSFGFDALRAGLGDAFVDELTYPGIFRGAPESVLPVLLEDGQRRALLINEADSAAHAAIHGQADLLTYGRYFTWDRDISAPPEGMGGLLRRLTGPAPVPLPASLPMGRYREIAATGPVALERGEVVRYRRRRIRRDGIEAQWCATRDRDAARLVPFVAGLRHGDVLGAALGAGELSFAPLDALCSEAGLGALLVSAPHEVEMFSGLPAAVNERLGILACFIPGAAEIELFLSGEGEMPGLAVSAPDGGGSLPDLLRGLAAGPVGALPVHLGAGKWLALEQAGLDMRDGSAPLRRWQDLRAGGDLVYFIVAAHAVLAGYEDIRSFLDRAGGVELRERDLVAIGRQGAERFARRHGFGGRLSGCFAILHSGARTLLPATAGDYPVCARDRTIAMDTGYFCHDDMGCVRGVSDIARTICAEPALREIHDALRATLVDVLIPGLKPGMSGAEAHAFGQGSLRPLEPALRGAGLLPDGAGIDGYRRDCGHALQRQTISSVYFLPGNEARLEAGMVGCGEFVWPTGDVLLAVEDGYYLTPQGGVPFTCE